MLGRLKHLADVEGAAAVDADGDRDPSEPPIMVVMPELMACSHKLR